MGLVQLRDVTFFAKRDRFVRPEQNREEDLLSLNPRIGLPLYFPMDGLGTGRDG